MKLKHALIVLLGMFIISGCGGDDEGNQYRCADCVDEPEALAANDNSGMGIYKGSVVGSTGRIKIDMNNAGGGLSMTLFIDDEEIELTPDDDYENGYDGYFYGTMEETDDVQVGFFVNANGSAVDVFDVIIPGHPNAEIVVIKEYSESLVEVFEGTFSGDESGVINLVFIHSDVNEGSGDIDGLMSLNGIIEIDGFVDEDGLIVVGDGEVLVDGQLKGHSMSGEWDNFNDASGTWKAKRTL